MLALKGTLQMSIHSIVRIFWSTSTHGDTIKYCDCIQLLNLMTTLKQGLHSELENTGYKQQTFPYSGNPHPAAMKISLKQVIRVVVVVIAVLYSIDARYTKVCAVRQYFLHLCLEEGELIISIFQTNTVTSSDLFDN